ncbi:hypothetical protein CDD81_4327 [Ophiocordyceps australis]|uniref:protein-tyrosine-phosphatase n=1 Tax=Ophiocordyceps australis TaxID=1399860 RepID=A0A2C5XJ63_9HYPO|nr:hypothetical protein CDD81_4327 [Ophiocordyceps australis]
MARPSKASHNMTHYIEYIPDRLYLAAYVQPPLEADGANKSAKAYSASAAPCYFSVDEWLLYNAFHHDFGPMHIGHLYRFAIRFHELLGAEENKERRVVFWSGADAKSRANAACLLACYMVLIQNWPPHLALAPIAQVNPPLMPFRDAGYSQADYGISVQDVVYGVWKAKEEKCCDLDKFDLEMYERYERVENGDFNWITPHFVAFASPQLSPVEKVAEGSPQHQALPRSVAAVAAHPQLPSPFKHVLGHFAQQKIGLVVRLNSPLYSPSFFEALGMSHLDMIFDDGTCPSLATVRKFIRLAHDTITVKKKAIAVHCKAGLGRTGCLIGAYLIYRHAFTANEIIAYMRFMRPGMVVGPQQHWLHMNQAVFREWWVEERVERRLRRHLAAPATPVRSKLPAHHNCQTATPPQNRSPSTRTPLGQVHDNSAPQDDCLPAPTPGQPRKTSRRHPYTRTTTKTSDKPSDASSSDEQVALYTAQSHTRVETSTSSSSPVASTAAVFVLEQDASHDVENINSLRVKHDRSVVLTKVRRRAADSPHRSRDAVAAGVRKTSGRVGSLGSMACSAAAVSTARKVSGS